MTSWFVHLNDKQKRWHKNAKVLAFLAALNRNNKTNEKKKREQKQSQSKKRSLAPDLLDW
jgi:hypothetical protein